MERCLNRVLVGNREVGMLMSCSAWHRKAKIKTPWKIIPILAQYMWQYSDTKVSFVCYITVSGLFVSVSTIQVQFSGQISSANFALLGIGVSTSYNLDSRFCYWKLSDILLQETCKINVYKGRLSPLHPLRPSAALMCLGILIIVVSR